jgi:hypothetical protein
MKLIQRMKSPVPCLAVTSLLLAAASFCAATRPPLALTTNAHQAALVSVSHYGSPKRPPNLPPLLVAPKPSPQSCEPVGPCPQHCTPALESGETTTPVDWCTYPNSGCPYDWQDIGTGCCYNPDVLSPILLDTTGEGFLLTDAAHGVWFDMIGNGLPLHIA